MKMIKEKLPLLAVLIALSVVLGMMINVPIPGSNGYFNLLDVGIYTTALLFGGPAGLVVGAVSGLLLDLLLGYPQWMIFSFVIHGLQGYIAGQWTQQKSWSTKVAILIIASFVMVSSYFLATGLLYGFGAAIVSLVGNVFQVSAGVAGAYLMTTALAKTKHQVGN
ncbi:ECF transporter S component [Vagococcus vulneris]|uniref:ECF transporter S component n=1 Tax=Vagococcus vulneris TaxID=1977869 RepID=A0A429ZV87_9ENTE|nr:ECF transporter S component [Vagococcus vulneris]RST97625.1 hypothetical protein CBF37_09640 [Vagococcus vulneris]